jgi:phytoene dehydrogenase-like protein
MNQNTSPQTIPNETDVVVIGAGIAGLCAALAAADGGARVIIVEAHEPGGRAATIEREGFHLNVGAHALYRGGHLTSMLSGRAIEMAGGIVSGNAIGVLVGGEICRIEMSPVGLLRNKVLRPRSRVRMATLFARLPRMKSANLVGHSLSDWLGGEPDDVRRFLEMFVRLSTYTHAPELFDAGAAVAQLQLATKGVRYLDGGWGRLIDVLRRLAIDAGVTVVSRTEVLEVRSNDGRVEVRCGDHWLVAKAAVIAGGGPDLASRLTGSDVADRHALTDPIAASCLDLALDRPHDDFVLGMDQPVYMSAHAPLAALAPPGRGLVSLMRYLAPNESPGEPAVARATLRDVARLAGIDDANVLFERPLHRMVVAHGAPTAVGGGMRGRPSITALGQKGIFVAGDWVGPTGLLADACSASGQQAGRAAALLCASIRA